jgi:hypothetical protein
MARWRVFALEGQRLEIDSEIDDASISEDQSSDSRGISYMNIIHDFYSNNSLDCLLLRAYITYQAVGRSDRTSTKKWQH